MASVAKIVGTGANETRGGGGIDTWTNPGNCTADDAVVTYTGDLTSTGYTDYLKATMNGNVFAIAADQQIDGIVVELGDLDTLDGEGDARIGEVILISSLGDGNDNTDLYVLNTGSLPATRSYGSSSDLWGLALTPAVVNGTDFGVKLSIENTTGANAKKPEVDFIRITVHHSDAPVDASNIIFID